jgi:hypothetical protein
MINSPEEEARYKKLRQKQRSRESKIAAVQRALKEESEEDKDSDDSSVDDKPPPPESTKSTGAKPTGVKSVARRMKSKVEIDLNKSSDEDSDEDSDGEGYDSCSDILVEIPGKGIAPSKKQLMQSMQDMVRNMRRHLIKNNEEHKLGVLLKCANEASPSLSNGEKRIIVKLRRRQLLWKQQAELKMLVSERDKVEQKFDLYSQLSEEQKKIVDSMTQDDIDMVKRLQEAHELAEKNAERAKKGLPPLKDKRKNLTPGLDKKVIQAAIAEFNEKEFFDDKELWMRRKKAHKKAAKGKPMKMHKVKPQKDAAHLPGHDDSGMDEVWDKLLSSHDDLLGSMRTSSLYGD